jgi:hypothetical protein
MNRSSSHSNASLVTRARALREELQENRRGWAEAERTSGTAGTGSGARLLLNAAQPLLARYAVGIVGGLLNRWSRSSTHDFARDARRLARRHPGLLMAGAFVAGAVLIHYLKTVNNASTGAAPLEHGQPPSRLD